MRGFVIALIVCSFALAFSSSAPAGAVLVDEECNGEPCFDSYVVYPLANWTVSGSSMAGESDGPSSCDPCDDCTVTVTWGYSGTGTYVVSHPGGVNFGSGTAGGLFYDSTECDGIPAKHTFTEVGVGSFTGLLFCPCIP